MKYSSERRQHVGLGRFDAGGREADFVAAVHGSVDAIRAHWQQIALFCGFVVIWAFVLDLFLR